MEFHFIWLNNLKCVECRESIFFHLKYSYFYSLFCPFESATQGDCTTRPPSHHLCPLKTKSYKTFLSVIPYSISTVSGYFQTGKLGPLRMAILQSPCWNGHKWNAQHDWSRKWIFTESSPQCKPFDKCLLYCPLAELKCLGCC